MEQVLKGLQGKTLTKKKLFDFLADINLEDICGKNKTIIVDHKQTTKQNNDEQNNQQKIDEQKIEQKINEQKNEQKIDKQKNEQKIDKQKNDKQNVNEQNNEQKIDKENNEQNNDKQNNEQKNEQKIDEQNNDEQNNDKQNVNEQNNEQTNEQKINEQNNEQKNEQKIDESNDNKIYKEKLSQEFTCGACMKIFTTKGSLQRHQDRFPVCKEWIEFPQKTDTIKLTKGLHLIIDELLEKAMFEKELECKFCKIRFTNKGNLHKHFNTSTVCNKMAYQEFKRLFNEL